jgi:hypothetical protein
MFITVPLFHFDIENVFFASASSDIMTKKETHPVIYSTPTCSIDCIPLLIEWKANNNENVDLTVTKMANIESELLHRWNNARSGISNAPLLISSISSMETCVSKAVGEASTTNTKASGAEILTFCVRIQSIRDNSQHQTTELVFSVERIIV